MSKQRVIKAVDEYVKSKDEPCIVLMLNDNQTKVEWSLYKVIQNTKEHIRPLFEDKVAT